MFVHQFSEVVLKLKLTIQERIERRERLITEGCVLRRVIQDVNEGEHGPMLRTAFVMIVIRNNQFVGRLTPKKTTPVTDVRVDVLQD